MITIHLYYYDDYNYILSSLKNLQFNERYHNGRYEKYENIAEDIKIIIYKDVKILAIQQINSQKCMKIKGLSLLKKVNLLDKKVFLTLFEKSFSKNLCNIKIDIDMDGEEEDIVEFMGHRLLEQNLLEQFDFYDKDSNITIKAYELQPKGYRYLVKVSLVNKLEFNTKYNDDEIARVILNLIVLVKLTAREGEMNKDNS